MGDRPPVNRSCEGIVDVDKTQLGKDMRQSTGGYEMVFSVVLFALAGVWLDRRFDTTPLFIIVLSILGMIGAVANVYYRYKREIERLEAETEALRSAGS